ncbi:MAG: hypothetical protein K1060chlam1_00313 [Candidatus Anoxychlamydiales bacterium]|nr:hypothetical protein [Candidatus Anoxychlamydiales bacterium]
MTSPALPPELLQLARDFSNRVEERLVKQDEHILVLQLKLARINAAVFGLTKKVKDLSDSFSSVSSDITVKKCTRVYQGICDSHEIGVKISCLHSLCKALFEAKKFEEILRYQGDLLRILEQNKTQESKKNEKIEMVEIAMYMTAKCFSDFVINKNEDEVVRKIADEIVNPILAKANFQMKQLMTFIVSYTMEVVRKWKNVNKNATELVEELIKVFAENSHQFSAYLD